MHALFHVKLLENFGGTLKENTIQIANQIALGINDAQQWLPISGIAELLVETCTTRQNV